MPFKAGERVRLKRDPSSMGIVTDAPPQEMTGRLMIEVEFPSGRARRPASQLERVEAENTLPQENVLGAIPFKRSTPPPKILKEPGDQSRLLLAYGLTRDITELHELRLPSEIEDIKPIPVQTFTMIDKDMI